MLGFATVLFFVCLSVYSYESYKQRQFQINVDYVYGQNHYKLRQMASEDVLCRDQHGELCFCGHCK